MAFILQIPFNELKYIWKWEDYEDFRDNLKDSHFQHFCVLDKLNTKYKRITLDDILNGNFKSDKTMCLIHFDKNPYLYQHWIVLTKDIGNSSYISKDYIYAHFGDGTTRVFTKSVFAKLFNSGWPQCAYVVGEGETVTPWYQKLYCALINIFL